MNQGEKSRKEVYKSIIVVVSVFLLAFIFSFQCSNNLFYTGPTLSDSSVFKYVARVIIDGGMPYKDTFDHKGPLVYLLNVAGIHIAYWRGIWAVEFVTLFATFIVMYKIARIKCRRITSFLLLVFAGSSLFKYFEGGNLTEEYAMPFIAISIFIFTNYFLNNDISKLGLIVCGISFGVVCLLRINMIPVWVVMCIGVLIICIKRKDINSLFRYLGLFMIGVCIVVIPIILWLMSGDAFAPFIEDYWVFNKTYSATAGWALRESAFVHFFNDTVIMMVIAAQIFNYLNGRKPFDLLYLVYIVGTLMMIAISGSVYMHYGMIIVPALIYPLANIISVTSKIDNNQWMGVIAVICLIIIAMPQWNSATLKMLDDYETRGINHIDDSDLRIIESIKSNTEKNEKIVVCANNDIYYNLSDRFSATKYSYTTPPLQISDKYRKEFFKELNAQKPEIIVLPSSYYDYEEIMVFINNNDYKTILTEESKGMVVYKSR